MDELDRPEDDGDIAGFPDFWIADPWVEDDGLWWIEEPAEPGEPEEEPAESGDDTAAGDGADGDEPGDEPLPEPDEPVAASAAGTDDDDVQDGTDDGDIIGGAGGDDVIAGGGGDDVLAGGAGDDVIDGSDGDDLVGGGDGDDAIAGGDGDDILTGDAGDDVMAGGAGCDLFIIDLASGAGSDTVLDFVRGEDMVWIEGDTASWEALDDSGDGILDASDRAVSIVAGSTVIDLSGLHGGLAGPATLTLANVTGIDLGDLIAGG